MPFLAKKTTSFPEWFSCACRFSLVNSFYDKIKISRYFCILQFIFYLINKEITSA